MAEQNQRLAQCFHCGNKGLLRIEKIHKYEYGGPVFDEVGDEVDFAPREIFSWFLLSCPVCEKVTLIQDYDFEDMPFTETVTLYPQSRLSLNNVPLYIRQSFEAALKIKNIDIAMCSIAFCDRDFPNITVHPIPKILLGRCEFGRDNYDLNVILQDEEEWEDEEIVNAAGSQSDVNEEGGAQDEKNG